MPTTQCRTFSGGTATHRCRSRGTRKVVSLLKRLTVQSTFVALLLSFSLPATSDTHDEQGKTLYQQCKRCHQVGDGARNRIGPHLNALFGRTAGSLEGFKFSPAMKNAGSNGLVWEEESLDAFLRDPRSLVPKSRMIFTGMDMAEERLALLAWLRGFSDEQSELPLAEPTSTPEEYGLDPAILSVVGDPDYGAYLAGECTTCHHETGGEQGIPSITGWPIDDFVIALHAYKTGAREHPVMQLVTARLSDEEIAALAAYFQHVEE